MAEADITARNSRASAFKIDYATATLTFLDGTSVLVTHTLADFADPVSGSIVANAVSDETILISGDADSVTLSSTAGEYTLTTGLAGSGADVIVSGSFTSGETSRINSATINFPA